MRTYTKAGFLVALLSIYVLGACSSDSSSEDKKVDSQSVTTDVIDSSPSDESEMDEAGQEIVLIDVRTMEEFAEGHLEGALNLNVEDGTLEAALLGLDPDASYQVYCRSGRRSAIAYDLMKANGFDDVADLGSLEEAAATTGLPVIS